MGLADRRKGGRVVKSTEVIDHRPIPELLTRTDIPEEEREAWTVERGAAIRGGSFTDFDTHTMRVPLDGTERAEVLRAHELMHARVTPGPGTLPAIEKIVEAINENWGTQMTLADIEAAEEMRTNVLLKAQGFDVGLLTDGTEEASAIQMAAHNDFDAAVRFAVALSGSEVPYQKFLAQLRKSDRKAWSKEIEDHITSMQEDLFCMTGDKMDRRVPKDVLPDLASTDMRSYGKMPGTELPAGFLTTSIEAAWSLATYRQQMAEQHAAEEARKQADAEQKRQQAEAERKAQQGEPTEKGTTGKAKDTAAQVRAQNAATKALQKRKPNAAPKAQDKTHRNVVCHPVRLTQNGPGSLFRKRIPAQSGRRVRRPHRLLTDPQRRLFDRRLRGPGGTVVCDSSGSMGLSREDIWDLLLDVPGATVIMYSGPQRPNTALLAKNGKMVSEIPNCGGGNDVDPYVLEWAAKYHRRGKEPMVWVSDWCTIDDALCLEMVKRYGIWQVDKIEEARWALQQGRGMTNSYRLSAQAQMRLQHLL